MCFGSAMGLLANSGTTWVHSDDEFYNRAMKSKDRKNRSGTEQQVETAESLLQKRLDIREALEKMRADLEVEERRKVDAEESSVKSESVDPLDAFMTTVSKDMSMYSLRYPVDHSNQCS